MANDNSASSTADTQELYKVGGWKRRSKKRVYENPWIEVSHEEVTRPNGTEGIYGIVHFKSRALGIIAVDEDNHTWLVRQSRYACDEYTYEIPEGGGSYDEPALAGAQQIGRAHV